MTQTERLSKLLRYFMDENPRYRNAALPVCETEQFTVLRGLLNIRKAVCLVALSL